MPNNCKNSEAISDATLFIHLSTELKENKKEQSHKHTRGDCFAFLLFPLTPIPKKSDIKKARNDGLRKEQLEWGKQNEAQQVYQPERSPQPKQPAAPFIMNTQPVPSLRAQRSNLSRNPFHPPEYRTERKQKGKVAQAYQRRLLRFFVIPFDSDA